jgi:hypothetical protein
VIYSLFYFLKDGDLVEVGEVIVLVFIKVSKCLPMASTRPLCFQKAPSSSLLLRIGEETDFDLGFLGGACRGSRGGGGKESTVNSLCWVIEVDEEDDSGKGDRLGFGGGTLGRNEVFDLFMAVSDMVFE